MRKILFVIPIIVLLAAGCNSAQQSSINQPSDQPVVQHTTTNPAPATPTPTNNTNNSQASLPPAANGPATRYGVQTKTSGCIANQALPDPACTPGAILTTNTSIVCVSGYTATVRNVPLSERERVFAEYGISYDLHSNYEVDHLISLELGGSNDISNLWPEPSNITNGSKTKDVLENHLHSEVCNGTMALTEAQAEISSDWLKYDSSVSPPKAQISPVSNSSGTSAPVPPPAAVPAGVTGKCNDGTYTEATNHQGACSHHGGVAQWY